MKGRKGRPSTRPTNLKDGFYIETRSTGGGSGIKIRRETEAEMLRAAAEYSKMKEVKVLGEYKDGKPIAEFLKKQEKLKAKKAKAKAKKEKEKAKKEKAE